MTRLCDVRPPARYDHPYRGHVEYVYDFPLTLGDGEYMWGYTVPAKRPGGKCLVHLSPIGSVVNNEVMTQETLRRLIRHELGHCNGWRHRDLPAPTTDVRQRFCVSVIEPPPSVKQDPEYDPNQWLVVREGPERSSRWSPKWDQLGISRPMPSMEAGRT